MTNKTNATIIEVTGRIADLPVSGRVIRRTIPAGHPLAGPLVEGEIVQDFWTGPDGGPVWLLDPALHTVSAAVLQALETVPVHALGARAPLTCDQARFMQAIQAEHRRAMAELRKADRPRPKARAAGPAWLEAIPEDAIRAAVRKSRGQWPPRHAGIVRDLPLPLARMAPQSYGSADGIVVRRLEARARALCGLPDPGDPDPPACPEAPDCCGRYGDPALCPDVRPDFPASEPRHPLAGTLAAW